MTLFRINFFAALTSLVEQRSRAVLSAVGIMVGSIAIILLVSIAQGVEVDIKKQVEDLGVNLLIVLPGRIEDGAMMNASLVGISQLKEENVQDVQAVPGVRQAIPLTFIGGGIKQGENLSPSTLAIAVDSGWFDMRATKLKEGRTFTSSEDNKAVCVIGGVATKKLFGEGVPSVGKSVNLGGVDYEIVGVTEDQESEQSLFSAGSFENVMVIPYGFAKSRNPGMQIDRIMIQTSPEVEPKSLVATVEKALIAKLDRESFSVLTQQDLLKLVYKLMGILTWLLIGLTSIALFVGGVGIMTVMLMSVNERAREIGIRKTVGARRSDVFLQFFSEAIVLAILGGLAGLAISYVVCLLLAAFTPIKPLVTWEVIAMSFSVAAGVGGVFGLVPAMKAAAKDPVVSLRNE